MLYSTRQWADTVATFIESGSGRWAGDTSKQWCPGLQEGDRSVDRKGMREGPWKVTDSQISQADTMIRPRKSKSAARVTFKRIRGSRLISVDTRAHCPGPKHAKTRGSDTMRVTQ